MKLQLFFIRAGGRALRFSCFAGSFSGNVRQVAFSDRSCRSAVKVTRFNKLPLQSLPVRAPIIFSFLPFSLFLILLFHYSIFDTGYWIFDVYFRILTGRCPMLFDIGYLFGFIFYHRALPFAIGTCQAFSLVKV
jgi:hypothetical protein